MSWQVDSSIVNKYAIDQKDMCDHEVILVKRSVKTTIVVQSKKREILEFIRLRVLSLLESVAGIYGWRSFNAIEDVLRKRDHI
jgi:hypothetical protein